MANAGSTTAAASGEAAASWRHAGAGSRLATAVLALALLLFASAAHADPFTVVAALRKQGCGGRQAPPIARDETLDATARDAARSGHLGKSLAGAAYPAEFSTLFHIKGSRDDTVIKQMLEQRYCSGVTDARYEEIGVFQSKDETWIVLAKRAAPPPNPDAASAARRVLELVNGARAAARACGKDRFTPAPPLALSPILSMAAETHAVDMAAHGNLDHHGSDGSTPGERMTRAGYTWRASSENIASGQRDADAVVAAWLASPGHCSNIMAPFVTEMGIAFALAPGKNPSIYWAQEFAAPR
jgi:uncharacterized protein YkwD